MNCLDAQWELKGIEGLKVSNKKQYVFLMMRTLGLEIHKSKRDETRRSWLFHRFSHLLSGVEASICCHSAPKLLAGRQDVVGIDGRASKNVVYVRSCGPDLELSCGGS